MSYLVLEDFRRGLDPRKFKLGAPAGTLTDFVNGHITNAGDIEKRKAFPAFSNLAILDDNGDQGTFGLQETATGLTVFGSAGLNGSAPSLGQPELASNIPVTSPVVSYQKLTHPAVLEGETYDRIKHRMTKLVWSELFGGEIQAVAEFADGRRFGYANGVLVEDYAAGLVLPHLNGDNTKLAAHLNRQLNLSDDYTATQLTFTTTNRTRAANVATLTLSGNPLTAGLAIGSKVRVAGVGGTGYNSSLVTLTNVSSSTISYANVGGNEGATADTGGTITTAVLTVTGEVGREFDVDVTQATAAGTVAGPTNTVTAVAPVAGASALGAFSITGGSANGVTPTAGTGSVVGNTIPVDGEYVLMGKKKYTFRNTPSVEGDVRINGLSGSFTNLRRAMLKSGGTPGTDYVVAYAHPWARPGTITGSGPYTLPLTAFKGSQGSLALSGTAGTSGGAVWTFNAFTGGAGNCVASVKVVKSDGTETELLSDAVQFSSDVTTTAALVRDNINAYTGTSGYTATVNENRVTILSSASASPMPNGYHVQVATGGDVLCGECLFYLTQQATTFTINTILVDGLDCLGGAETFPTPPVDTLPEYYAELVRVINTRSGITGINGWTNGQYVKVSRISTRDDDQPLVVYITPGVAGGVGIVFGDPPPLTQPISVTLPESASTVGSDARLTSFSSSVSMTAQVTAAIKGGNGLYSIEWLTEYAGSQSGSLAAYAYIIANGLVQPQFGSYPVSYTITHANNASRTNAFAFTLQPSGLFPTLNGYGIDVQPFTVRYLVRCRVTDSAGNVATSDPCSVEFQIT